MNHFVRANPLSVSICLGLAAALLAFAVATVVSTVFRDPVLPLIGTAAAIAAVGILSSRRDATLATVAIACAALAMDFGPLSLYRYFLWSDLFILVATGWLALTRSPMSIRGLDLLLALFAVNLLSSLVSFARAPRPELGVFTWLHMAFMMMAYIPAVTAALRARPQLADIARRGLITSGVIQSAVVVAAVAEGLHWQTGTRISGAMGNHALWLFVTAWTGLLAVLLSARWFQVMWVVPAMTIVAYASMVMRSRSLWIAIIVSTSIYILVHVRRRLVGALAVLILVAAATLGYVLELYPSAIQARISQTLRPSQSLDLVYRVDVVRRLFEPWSQNVFVGVGTRQSADYLPGAMIEGKVEAVHNVVLHAAMEGGLLAGLAWLLLPAVILRMWWVARVAHRESADWAMASLLAIYVGGQFTPTLFEHVFYFLLGFLAALRPDYRFNIAGVAEVRVGPSPSAVGISR